METQKIGKIPFPKYDSKDFLDTTYWRLRGKLDVPKERWLGLSSLARALMAPWSSPGPATITCNLPGPISAYYVEVQEHLGGRDDPRLVPLLACIVELLPWLKQWHNDVDPEFGVPMGDYFEGFLQEEARQLGKTTDEIRAWQPPQRTARRSRTSGAKNRKTYGR